MDRKTRSQLIAAGVLILIGCVLFVGVMTVCKWDFSKLSTAKYETMEYPLRESFRDISITADTADIMFKLSETSKIVCHEQKNIKHMVTVQDDVLRIELIDTRKWYEYIGLSFETPRITVYLPQGVYGALSVESSTGDVEVPETLMFDSIAISLSTGHVTENASVTGDIKVKTSTGSVRVEGISAANMDLSVSTGAVKVADVTCKGDIQNSVSTGRVSMKDVQCRSILSEGDTGAVVMEGVIAEERICIERSTGDVHLVDCDAAELFVKTSTGDVDGTLLSEKVFIVRTDTGRVDVPKTVNGGRCEITTDTGDISFAVVS